MRAEIERGVSLTFAVRLCGELCGEAVLYAFDGRGGAEFATRLLPEWQGLGLGTESVRAICAAAAEIGLIRLSTKVMKENIASIGMLKKITDKQSDCGDAIIFRIDPRVDTDQ